MSKDDFAVIAYKILAYLYECIRSGVEPSVAMAKEVANCNDVYWKTVVDSLITKGYVSGDAVTAWGGDVVGFSSLSITMDGVEYLTENSKMTKVRKFLGKAFVLSLSNAVSVTAALW